MTIERVLGACDIAAAPRVPLPFVEQIIRPGETIELEAFPQLILAGPYWLGIRYADWIDVLSIRFGLNETLVACGAVPAEYLAFDPSKPFPLHMVPIDGPPLVPGMPARLRLRNPTSMTLDCRAVLWGTGEREAKQGPIRRLRESIDRALSAESARRAVDGWNEAAEQAREADRIATVEQLRPYEPSDVWESPTDES